ncbi:hypothetical protein J6TS2_45550 [Heyndrickxia sporothermodurans]|nr:hypothetical protein J6TS2_45550 [Heyndrickxia sporothermodurans]
MKKIFVLIAAILLCFNMLPKISLATPNKDELKTYLESIGITEKELNDHLEYYYDESIKSFSSIDDLKKVIGEPINNNNFKQILTKYDFKDEAEVKAFLVENGDMEKGDSIYEVYHFTNALDEAISFYIGTPITDKNLKELLNDYDMTYEELLDLLKKNEDSINNYQYIEDLEDAIITYSDDMFTDVFTEIFKEIGITDKEIENLMNHFMSIKMDESAEQKLEKISERMMAIGDFESESDLSNEQIQEIVNAYQEMLSIFQLHSKFYLVKGSEKKPVTLNELVNMKSTNGYNLLIELYDYNGKLLADIIITPDLFGSEIIKKTVGKIEKVEKTVAKPIKKTIRGGELPNTSGFYGNYLLAGFVMLLLGLFMFRKWRAMNE